MTMSTEVETTQPGAMGEEFGAYRALCPAAIASVLLSMLSLFAVLSMFLVLIPILGVLIGLYALLQIRQHPTELAGSMLALVGIALSGVLVVGTSALHVYVHMTEVPDDHRRIHYWQLQPEEGVVDQETPPFAKDIDGEKVFIKGYMYPGPIKNGIQQFLLVRDKGDCCFGGDPKITDRIQVKLAGSNHIAFDPGLQKVAGTFRLKRDSNADAIDAGGEVFYYLDNCVAWMGWKKPSIGQDSVDPEQEQSPSTEASAQ
jgi:hypothetical protein